MTEPVLSERVQRWRDGGAFETVAGRRLFVVRRSGERPLLLLLHGFPSSSYDWRRLMDVRPDHAVVAFDCLGFGLSDKPAGFEYTLARQADAAEALVARGGHDEVFIVGHDMGTSVATELLDRASPTPGQKLLRSRFGPLFSRLNTERTFTAQFRRIFSDRHPLGDEEAADQWALLAHSDGHRRLPETINYMNERERLTERWHGAVRDWQGPLSLAWGLEDPVATTNVLAGLRVLRPSAPVTELAGVGHYPQIEVPEQIGQALDAALRLV